MTCTARARRQMSDRSAPVFSLAGCEDDGDEWSAGSTRGKDFLPRKESEVVL